MGDSIFPNRLTYNNSMISKPLLQELPFHFNPSIPPPLIGPTPIVARPFACLPHGIGLNNCHTQETKDDCFAIFKTLKKLHQNAPTAQIPATILPGTITTNNHISGRNQQTNISSIRPKSDQMQKTHLLAYTSGQNLHKDFPAITSNQNQPPNSSAITPGKNPQTNLSEITIDKNQQTDLSSNTSDKYQETNPYTSALCSSVPNQVKISPYIHRYDQTTSLTSRIEKKATIQEKKIRQTYLQHFSAYGMAYKNIVHNQPGDHVPAHYQEQDQKYFNETNIRDFSLPSQTTPTINSGIQEVS